MLTGHADQLRRLGMRKGAQSPWSVVHSPRSHPSREPGPQTVGIGRRPVGLQESDEVILR